MCIRDSFRSEFLYLESGDYPTEDEQFKAYKMVAETMAGKKVIIRTLDIGADKMCIRDRKYIIVT